ARRIPLANLVGRRVRRQHDREDPRVAHAARDQLRVLAPEVEDDDRPRRAHARLAFQRSAMGAASPAAGSTATPGAANGAAAASRGATSDPGACRSASCSPTQKRTTLARKKSGGNAIAKARP